MSQNPYSPNADFAPPPEARTSVLAVMSLVFGIVCIPGLGLIGLILGIAALFGISRSEGRVRGQGMAVAGILIGLVFTVLWVGAGMGAAYVNGAFTKTIAGPSAAVLTAVEAGDFKSARDTISTAGGVTITDEQLAAFTAAYQSELGKFKSMPESLGARFGAYMESGPLMQNLNQGKPGVVPIPAYFDKGLALLLVQLPTGNQPPPAGGAGSVPILNVGVLTPSGKELWLLPTTGAPSPPPVEDGDPEGPADGDGG